ncbi:MAG TPA: LysR family transcriptional regulator [Acidobacteriaceae bacterium]|nr:LysR family transcriptional regulator [Acidobacteriaceae bacterium]
MAIYDHLEFRHIVYIMAIADQGSFSRAADKVHVAQSALSQQISDLEDLYGVRFFNRGRHGAVLTPEGQSFCNFGQQMLELREEAINSIKAVRETTSKPFRLGFSQFVEHGVLHTVSQAYRELFPEGEVLAEGNDNDELLRRLKSGELDAALVTLPLGFGGLSAQPVMHERMVVLIRKDDPLAEQSELSSSDLTGKLAIFSDPRHHLSAHTKLLEMLEEQNIQPKITTPTFNFEHIQWMVSERMCLALVRENEVLRDTLTTRQIANVTWTIDSAIVYRQEDRQGALSLLLKDLSRRFPGTDIKPRRRQPQSVIAEELPFESGYRKKNA